jgi:hypothetical protein
MDLDGEKWISPHPNPYVQPHINNRYHTLVILWTRDKRETRDFRAHSEMVLLFYSGAQMTKSTILTF